MRRRMAVAAMCVPALGLAARAAEHVTLRNGFEFDCQRHEAIDATHVRFFLNADGSYQDLLAADVVRMDAVPDAVAPRPALQAEAVERAMTPTASVDDLLKVAGAAHNIDAALLASVVHAESGGRTRAVSRAGAGGLMQLMPGTARDLGVKNVFQADENIKGGTAYLDTLLTRYKDNVVLALAAYNAGPAAVDKYHGVPPYRETRAYVAKVIHRYNQAVLAQRKTAGAAVAAVLPSR